MKKLLPLLLVLALPRLAEASCTYATPGGSTTTVVTCTTTTEAAPTLVSEGRSLAGLRGLTVVVDTTGTMTAGGTLQAYFWNAGGGNWSRAPELDLTVQALPRQAFLGLVVSVPWGRIDYKPTGIGAVTSTIYLIGAGP